MINYTDRISLLMRDIVARVPTLGFIDLDEVLVFARWGRSDAEGAFATCHCLNLPPSEPGYYFWRDRTSGEVTRRSEWFVTKSPIVRVGNQAITYLISFALPRFCDQSLQRSRKAEFFPGADPWLAKLDTLVHELYHIDPAESGIRRIEREDGTYARHSHGPGFYEDVAAMVKHYLASGPDPELYAFLREDFSSLQAGHGEIVATTFRTFPSYPQRYMEVLADQPRVSGERADVRIEPLRAPTQPREYTERDLVVRRFRRRGARRAASRELAA
ncbi:MAG: hypothetical protein HYZ58_04660 [Acidobacteria bacterium]|nr:hypothetical protein [Acidobacteriota bacterium]